MLGRIVLIIIQFAVAWRLAPEIERFLPPLGQLEIFAYALIFALIVFVLGVIGHLVLKDVAQPTPSTLAASVILALICAALTLFPDITRAINSVINVPILLYPLVGAVIGYAIKK